MKKLSQQQLDQVQQDIEFVIQTINNNTPNYPKTPPERYFHQLFQETFDKSYLELLENNAFTQIHTWELRMINLGASRAQLEEYRGLMDLLTEIASRITPILPLMVRTAHQELSSLYDDMDDLEYEND